MKRVVKPIALLMTVLVALGAFAVGAFATDSAEKAYSHPEGIYTLAGGTDTDTAKAVGIGETVYSSVAAGEAAVYKLYSPASTTLVFSFKASAAADITIAKLESATKTVLSAESAYNESIALENAYYYITVTPYVAPVEPETPDTTEPDADTGSDVAPQSEDENEAADVEFYFVTSVEGMQEAPKVDISAKEASIVSGESLQLKLSNCNIENLNFFWRVVDDPATTLVDETEIVTVSKDGLVTVMPNSAVFNKDTTVKVQAVMYYNNDEWTKTCTVTAVPANIFLDPYYDTSDTGCLVLGVGAYRTIAATTNIKDAKIIWSSDNTDIATVNSAGKIEAVAVGKATIKATIEGTNVARRILVDVKQNHVSVMDLKFDEHTATTRVDDTTTLKYTFTTAPDGKVPTNSKVTFVSDKPEIATVNEDGKVTGVAVGTATITITSDDGSFVDKCTVTVKEAIPNWLMVIIAPIRIIYNLIMMIIGK